MRLSVTTGKLMMVGWFRYKCALQEIVILFVCLTLTVKDKHILEAHDI